MEIELVVDLHINEVDGEDVVEIELIEIQKMGGRDFYDRDQMDGIEIEIVNMNGIDMRR